MRDTVRTFSDFQGCLQCITCGNDGVAGGAISLSDNDHLRRNFFAGVLQRGIGPGAHGKDYIVIAPQRADGSVVIPEALRKYLGGMEIIEKK